MLFLRTYNVALDDSTAGSLKIRVPIFKASGSDYATSSDWTPATGDVKVSKDGGAQANIGTLPSYSNGDWVFVLTGTELSAKSISVRIVDSATKAIADASFNVETCGNTSAMWGPDYKDSQRLGLVALPSTGTLAVKPAVTLSAADVTGSLPSNVTQLGGSTSAAGGLAGAGQQYSDFTYFPANVTKWGGTNVTTGDIAIKTTLAKTTHITGFNDIAATAIVSGGAITTSGGAISNVATVTTLTGHTAQTGDAYARIGANGAGLTSLGDTRLTNLDATVSSRSTFAGGAVTSVTGSVGSVTGNVGGSVGSISGVTFPTGFNGLTVGAIQSGLMTSAGYTAPLDSTATQAAATAALNAYDPPTKAEMDSGLSGVPAAVDTQLSAEHGDGLWEDGDGGGGSTTNISAEQNVIRGGS